MSEPFIERSGMLKLAEINWNLLLSMWKGLARQNHHLKIFLFVPIVIYSTLCIFLTAFFCIASILDLLPYYISVAAGSLCSLVEDISKTNYGIFSTIFYPPIVFMVGILMVLAIMLPKAARIPQDKF
jgi:hypothetical protein